MKKLRNKISVFCLILCMLLLVAMPAFAEETYADPTISVEKVTAQPGDTVEVAITVHNNPGIVSAAVYIDYDPEGLELKRVKNCGLMDLTVEEEPELNDDLDTEMTCSQKRDEIPYYIWISCEERPYDCTKNDNMVILTFAVKEDAEAKEYPIRIVEDNMEDFPYEIYNFYMDDVSFNFVNGSVTVGAAACTHAGKTAVPAVDPDCENPGNNLYYTCGACGKVLKADGITETTVEAEQLPALGHDMQKTADEVAPECEVDGKEAVYTCANGCGKTTGGEVIPAPGHTFLNYVYNNNATCVANGTKTAKCEDCEETDTKADEAHPATGHNMQETAAEVAPKCEVAGKTAVYTCANGCGKTEGGAAIPALEHDMQKTADEVAPKCEVAGKTAVYTCANGCGKTEGGAAIPALEHDMQKTAEQVAPWCEETGKTAVYTCANGCGKTEGGEEIPSLGGHLYGTIWYESKAATCTEEGEEYCTCVRCFDKKTRKIPALEHDMQKTAEEVAPKCEVAGKEAVYTCANGCGKTEGGAAIPALEHNMQKTADEVAPECEVPGKTAVYTCANGCGKTTGGAPIPALEHDMKKTADEVAPKCEVAGKTAVYTCANGCGKTEGGAAIPALEHDMQKTADEVAPKCEVAGKTAVYTCANGCGKTTGGTEIPASGHTPNIPAPTETEDQVCTVCGHVIAPKLGHICKDHLTFHKAVEATCTEEGNIAYYACTCGKLYADEEATEEIANVVIAAKGHDMKETSAKVEATCEDAGKEAVYTCANGCGKTEGGETIPAKGHNKVEDAAKEPNCVEEGKSAGSHCDRCGIVLEEQIIIPALGHTPVEDKAVDATCSSTGLTAGSHCSVCGEILTAQEVVPKLDHTEVSVPAVAPTCTTTGLTEGKKCSVCNEVIVAQETVPVVGHTEEVLPAVEPTCETAGKTAGAKCSVCGTTLVAQENIEPLGHDMYETEPGLEPNCLTPGKTAVYSCHNGCGKTEGGQEIPATGHQWVNGTCTVCAEVCHHEDMDENGNCPTCGGGCEHEYESVVTEPTCTAQGYTLHTCSLCGSSYKSNYTDAKGHSFVDATCTAPKTCSVCGATDGEALGHNYTSTVTPPTCAAQGYTTYTCTVCGHSYQDNFVAMLVHVPGSPVEENRTEATCTAEGKYDTVVYCTECNGEVSRVETVIPAKDHTEKTEMVEVENGFDKVSSCEVCGVELKRTYLRILGDINLDGVVDHTDVNMAYNYVKGNKAIIEGDSKADIAQFEIADVNKDGKLDHSDVNQLYGYIKLQEASGWAPYMVEVDYE